MSKKPASTPYPLRSEDQNEPEQRHDLSVLCSERASGISSLPVERVERAVRPDEVQHTLLRALQDAITQARELLYGDCPTYRPITPVVRVDAMEQRLNAMLRAVNLVRPALQKFYGSLSDEQKERFNRLAPTGGSDTTDLTKGSAKHGGGCTTQTYQVPSIATGDMTSVNVMRC